ncbi:MAG: Ig-like domain-containing protein, partial [Chloroflexi bacterium]|nr:Ig-like domain-containing protein [Chloroflexota bacterium]
RLALDAAPAVLMAGGSPNGMLSIMLTDAANRLVTARQDVTVVLSSSNPSVAALEARAMIPRGSSFIIVEIQANDAGASTLTAVSEGFRSEFLEVQVVAPGGPPAALSVRLSPPVLPVDTAASRGLIVQVLDESGVPTAFPCTIIHLASSATQVLQVSSTLQSACEENQQYAATSLASGVVPGLATITVASTGLRPASIDGAVQGQSPARLTIYQAPGRLLTIEPSPLVAIVQVLDQEGTPVTRHLGIPFTIVEEGSGELAQATIPAGASYVAVPIPDTVAADGNQLWAISPDLAPGSHLLRVHRPEASLNLSASSLMLFPGEITTVLVTFTSDGVPVPGANLTWTSGLSASIEPPTRTDVNGEAWVTYTADSPGDWGITVTADLPGYDSATAELVVSIVSPLESQTTGDPSYLGVQTKFWLLGLGASLLGYVYVQLRNDRQPDPDDE